MGEKKWASKMKQHEKIVKNKKKIIKPIAKNQSYNLLHTKEEYSKKCLNFSNL